MAVETKWWWIRHAPVIVTDGLIYGQDDPPANADDPARGAALARILPADAVLVTSQLQRTHQTAAAIRAGGLDLPEARIEPGLAEQHLGVWQGQSREKVADSAGFQRFWLAPADYRPDGGESFVDLTQRVQPVIDRLCTRFAGRDIIAVTHGGTIRAAIGHATGLTPARALAFHIGNWSITRLHHHSADATHPRAEWSIHGINIDPVTGI